MIEIKKVKITSSETPILADIYFQKQNNKKLILFCHGFKGFKDWGCWHLVAKAFAEAGFIFLKFNFSYNGLGQEKHQDFTRLDLFFKNNYSRELEDLKKVLDWSKTAEEIKSLDIKERGLIGHSRGGGIALQSTVTLKDVYRLATWASISHFNRFGDNKMIADWKREGSRNFYNSRTQQDMKIGVQFYEDYITKKHILNLETAAKQLKKPYLILHGKQDEAVGFSHAQRLKRWCPQAQLHLIEGANHVFGAKHPYTENHLPDHLNEVVVKTIKFFS